MRPNRGHVFETASAAIRWQPAGHVLTSRAVLLAAAFIALVGALTSPGEARAAPDNDDFAQAVVLSGSEVRASGSNVGASVEVGEPVHGSNEGGRSVWWTWTAPASGPVLIDTLVSRFDTLLGIYTGSSLESLIEVAGNDDAGNRLSRVIFDAAAGTTYYIVVDGHEGVMGNIGLRITSRFTRVPDDYSTIQAAVDAAGPGDTILVRPGIYREALDLGNRDIALVGEEGAHVTILEPPLGQMLARHLIVGPGTQSDAIIVGFGIRGPETHPTSNLIGVSPDASASIVSNRLSGATQHAISASAGTGLLVLDNWIEDTTGSGVRVFGFSGGSIEIVDNEITGVSGAAVAISQSTPAHISNNRIHGNGGPAITAFHTHHPNEIIQNIIFDNGDPISTDILVWGIEPLFLANTIHTTTGNTIRIFPVEHALVGNVLVSESEFPVINCEFAGGHDFTADRGNLLVGGSGGEFSAGCLGVEANDIGIAATPGIESPTNQDFSLAGGSPGIGLLTSGHPLLPPLDFNGNVRGVEIDAGAIGYQPTGTIEFSSATYSAGEMDGTIEIELVRRGGTEGEVTAVVSVIGGSATVAQDYISLPPFPVTFTAGDGQPKRFTITILDDDSVENAESIRLGLHDPDPGTWLGRNRKATAVILSDKPDLAVTASAADQQPSSLEDGVVTFIVENRGNSPAEGATLTLSTPLHFAIESILIQSNDASCSTPTDTWIFSTCTLGDVPAGETRTVTVRFANPNGHRLELTGAVATTSLDLDRDNDTASAILQFHDQDDLSLSLTQTLDPSSMLGGPTFAFEVRNHGRSNASFVKLEFQLPPEATDLRMDLSGVSCTDVESRPGFVVCSSHTSFSSDDIYSGRIGFKLDTSADAEISAVVSSHDPERDPADNAATVLLEALRLHDYQTISPTTEFDTYLINGRGIRVERYRIGSTTVGGRPAYRVSIPGGGFGIATLDEDGMQMHSIVEQDPDLGRLSVTFDPPVRVFPARFHLGSIDESAGRASVTVPGEGRFNLKYESSTLIEGVEEVTVPLGTFETLRTRWNLKLSGRIRGRHVSTGLTDTTWFAPGVGDVKSVLRDNSKVETSERIGYTPELLSPVPETVLERHDHQFTWSLNGTPATQLRLFVGSAPGRADFFDSGTLPATTTSQEVWGLPMMGGPVHARLRMRIKGRWYHRDFAFTTTELPLPALTAPGTDTLDGATTTFRWAPNGHGVTHWRLRLGTRRGRSDYFDSRNLAGEVLEQVVVGLPATGETIHARLQWRAAGRWFSEDHEFTAADLPPPALLAPVGEALSASDVLLRWTGNGHAITHWRARVGFTARSGQLVRLGDPVRDHQRGSRRRAAGFRTSPAPAPYVATARKVACPGPPADCRRSSRASATRARRAYTLRLPCALAMERQRPRGYPLAPCVWGSVADAATTSTPETSPVMSLSRW